MYGVYHLTDMEWLSMTGYVMMRVDCHKSRPPSALVILCTVLFLSESIPCVDVTDGKREFRRHKHHTILFRLSTPSTSNLSFIRPPALNTVHFYNNTRQTKTGIKY